MKEWIKKGKPFRNPEFLYKRIIERENCSLEEAKAILDQIVAGDRSLRYITAQARGRVGFTPITPSGRHIPQRTVIAYHEYLEPNGVYLGRRRGRPLERRL